MTRLTVVSSQPKEAPVGADLQSSDAVLMVRPAAFGFNPETAATNVFATAGSSECAETVLAEFDRAARRLAGAGVEVVLLEDTLNPPKPDAAFPNNWVSFHGDGKLVLYPMAALTRRPERRLDALLERLTCHGFTVGEVIDLSAHERSDRFLEGTGSLVLDRPRRRAYAAISPRTHPEVLDQFEQRLGYSVFAFGTADHLGRPIYHTNVMMSLGRRFAAVCSEVVPRGQLQALTDDLEAGGRDIILVDYRQLRGFACNLLELRSYSGESLIAMSASARASLRPDQLASIERVGGEVIDIAIPTIEAVAGGSLRCMVADIHLPRFIRGF